MFNTSKNELFSDYVKMSEKEDTTERDELLNWNENETFATSEATSRVSDVELLKVSSISRILENFQKFRKFFSDVGKPQLSNETRFKSRRLVKVR